MPTTVMASASVRPIQPMRATTPVAKERIGREAISTLRFSIRAVISERSTAPNTKSSAAPVTASPT